MANYWLCITNNQNWEIIKEKKIWGVSKRHEKAIRKSKIGDKLIFYVKQENQKGKIIEPRIVGVFEVASDVYEESTKIFKAPPKTNETYPLRIKVKPLILGEIKFKPLLPQLTFIKNKKRWSGHLMGKAMRPIPREDYELIRRLMESKQGP